MVLDTTEWCQALSEHKDHLIPMFLCANNYKYFGHYIGPYVSLFSLVPYALTFIFFSIASKTGWFRSLGYFIISLLFFIITYFVQVAVKTPRPYPECSQWNPFVMKYGFPLADFIYGMNTFIFEILLCYMFSIPITNSDLTNYTVHGEMEKFSWIDFFKHMNKRQYKYAKQKFKVVVWSCVAVLYMVLYYLSWLGSVTQIVSSTVISIIFVFGCYFFVEWVASIFFF